MTKTLENILGKRENPGNQHFLLFLPCFLPYLRQLPKFEPHSNLSSANALTFDRPKSLS